MFYESKIGAAERAKKLTAQTVVFNPEQEVRAAHEKIKLLQNDVERLLMISEALWLLLKREHGYSESVLSDLIMEIDASDGKVDGKVGSTPPRQCPSCNRLLAKKRQFCLYCGQPVPIAPFER